MSRSTQKKITEFEDDSKTDMTYYEVLGVSEDAKFSEIKKSFRQLAIEFHPDNKNSGDAVLFSLVARAYECLSSDSKRTEYNQMLKIEKTAKKAIYVNQKKAFEDFMKAQENEMSQEKRNRAESKYKLDFVNLDARTGFDRKRYEQEKDNPLVDKDAKSRLDNLLSSREQDDIEFSQRKIFEGDFSHEKFNKLFENKYKKNTDLAKLSHISAFNGNGADPGLFDGNEKDFDDLFNDNDDETNNTDIFSSLSNMNEILQITDDDIKKLKTMKGQYEYKGHSLDRGKHYQTDLERKIKEREIYDSECDARKIADFNTDPNMGGYGILNKAGLSGKELDWDNEDIDDKTFERLIEYRKAKTDLRRKFKN